MNKLCLLTNLTSSEMAAWVQALGSIAVLAIMVGIAKWQNSEQSKQRAADLLERQARIWTLSDLFSASIIVAIDDMIFGAQGEMPTKIRANQFVIKDILEWGSNIDLQILTPAGAVGLTRIRGVALETLNFTEGTLPTWGHLATNLTKFRDRANEHGREIKNAVPPRVDDYRNANHPG